MSGHAACGLTVPAQVVILANKSDAGSLAVAHYYATRRNIPEENIVSLPMSEKETITWPEFVETIFNPLRKWLVDHGWLAVTGRGGLDEMGRRRYRITGHSIGFLVVCRGVPVRIANDRNLFPKTIPEDLRSLLRRNDAAVDSELALLSRDDSPTLAALRNPLFNVENPTGEERALMVRVSRLDGPTVADAEALVDEALNVERNGLRGRAYVDLKGPHRIGDRWLAQTADELRRAGFDLSEENTRARFGLTARFDAPALYFGWYTPNVDGPFLTPGFRFASGAIAMHIHSSSASHVRSMTRSWVGPLIGRGAAASFGNVNEPFLELTLEPQLLVKALLAGKSLGAATAYATPYLSWQCLAIGDPLYRPFKVSLKAQLKTAMSRQNVPLDQYVFIREANLLDAAGKRREADRLIHSAYERDPGAATALAWAGRQQKSGDRNGAGKTLHWFLRVKNLSANQAGAVLEAVDDFQKLGDSEDALALDAKLINARSLGDSWHLSVLESAIPLARRLGHQDLFAKWTAERDRLRPPSAKKSGANENVGKKAGRGAVGN